MFDSRVLCEFITQCLGHLLPKKKTISLIKRIYHSFQWYEIVFSLVCHCCSFLSDISSATDASTPISLKMCNILGALPMPSGAASLKGNRGQPVNPRARRNLNPCVSGGNHRRPQLLITHIGTFATSKGQCSITATNPPFACHVSARVESYNLAEDDCGYL